MIELKKFDNFNENNYEYLKLQWNVFCPQTGYTFDQITKLTLNVSPVIVPVDTGVKIP